MLAVSMGMMVNGLSVFFLPLNEEFGWQRGSVSLINLCAMLGLAGGGIVMGRIADRTSTRRVCLVGAIVLGLCILGASRADALWQFYLLFFLADFLAAARFLLRLSPTWATGLRAMPDWHWGSPPPARLWDKAAFPMASPS